MNKDTLEFKFNFQHIPVQSSRFLSVAWGQDTLQVKFTNGSLYNYYNVPEQVFLDLIDPDLSVSKGVFLQHSVIAPANNPKNKKRWSKKVK